jgi:alkylation response protein AidB-like acyl-CoA dehydrogenase
VSMGKGQLTECVSDGESEVGRTARRWFETNWDPDLTLGQWWKRLAESGWGYPTWPIGWYGQGLSQPASRTVTEARRIVGALGPVSGVATTLAAPTILAWGTDEQKQRFLPDIVEGRKLWCQLFSEPSAGSDLASLQTRAVYDGNEWIVTGQKVWSSGAHLADYGILLARTNPEATKHHGITFFLIDMRQSGIEIRPIREMTGDALFNEVFLDGARVHDRDRIGEIDSGWRVASTTLSHERTSLGAGRMGGSGALPWLRFTRPDLDERVGDIAKRAAAGVRTYRYGGGNGDLLVELASGHGKLADPVIRQKIARVYSLMRIGVFTQGRIDATVLRGGTVGPEASIGKASRLIRDALLEVIGPVGMLAAQHDERAKRVQKLVLSSPVWSIGGGTDEVQRNIIAERVLGLPPEPRLDGGVAFCHASVTSSSTSPKPATRSRET